jgi:hypothetical protein
MYVTLVPLLTATMELIVQMTPVMQLTVVPPPTHQLMEIVMTAFHARSTLVINSVLRELVVRTTIRMTLPVMTQMSVPTMFVLLQVPLRQVASTPTTPFHVMTACTVRWMMIVQAVHVLV